MIREGPFEKIILEAETLNMKRKSKLFENHEEVISRQVKAHKSEGSLLYLRTKDFCVWNGEPRRKIAADEIWGVYSLGPLYFWPNHCKSLLKSPSYNPCLKSLKALITSSFALKLQSFRNKQNSLIWRSRPSTNHFITCPLLFHLYHVPVKKETVTLS